MANYIDSLVQSKYLNGDKFNVLDLVNILKVIPFFEVYFLVDFYNTKV